MMFKTTQNRAVIFDTEYTTWEGAFERNWNKPGEHQEIAQIGAVKIDAANLIEIDALVIYVKPVKNPILSSYFISLTGITQETVDKKGIAYADALKQFIDWSGELPLYSWGEDREVMKKNAALLDIPFPIEDARFFDVREIFQKSGIEVNDYMSSTIPRAFGEEPPRDAHDALNDARSIILGLRLLARRKGN